MKELITSRQNPLVKEIRSLTRRGEREETGTFTAEGVKFVGEALKGPFPVRRILFSPKLLKIADGQELLDNASEQDIPFVEVSDEIMEYISGTESPQGVIAHLEMAGAGGASLEDILGKPETLALVVDGVQDPGNLGTLIRSAHAAGASGVMLLTGTVDLFNPKALRATMGSVFHVPVVADVEPKVAAEACAKYGVRLLSAEGGSYGGKVYTGEDLTGPVAILLGSEGHGPSEEARSLADGTVSIPLPGGAESLNVAVAAAVLLFEAVRQRTN